MPYKDRNRQLEAQRNHYRKNKQAYIERSKIHRQRRRDFLNQYKSQIGCLLCSENEACCLCFHHLNNKVDTIARLVYYASIDKIMKEIEKCVVVCHNCHAKIHAKLVHI